MLKHAIFDKVTLPDYKINRHYEFISNSTAETIHNY